MLDITPEDLQKKLDSGTDVFLKLWKPGCGACRMSNSALERMESANPHSLEFCQINTDEHPEMLSIADTEVLPTFFVFKNQKRTGTFIGFKGMAKLEAFVDEACGA